MGTHNVTCHFCSMQDKFTLSFADVFDSAHFGQESFVKSLYNSGERRVCPRGNFCVELCQHKLRTSYARIDGEHAITDEAISTIASRIGEIEPSKIAILLSGSLPLEDAYLAVKLAQKLGTDLVAQIYSEDDVAAKFLNKFSFDELSLQQTIVAIGDVFSLNPTIARPIHNARFAARRNTFAVIDNCRTRTSRYSWSFLRAKPGKVADIIEALAKNISGENVSINDTGVDASAFERLASIIKNTDKGTILFAPGVAHFAEPLRIGFWAKKLAETKQFNFAAMGTAANGRGISRLLSAFGFSGTNNVLNAIGNGEVDALLCLGCDPIEAYPRMFEHIQKIGFISATTTLPTAIYQIANVVVPSLHLFERKGTLLSLEEKFVSMDDPLPSPNYPGESGVLSALLNNLGESSSVSPSDIQQKISDFTFLVEEPEPHTASSTDLCAIGYHLPHHYGDGSLTRRSTWVRRYAEKSDNAAIISPALAEKLNVKNGDSVAVQTEHGKSEFSVSIENDQFDDVILIPAYMPNARPLLGWCSKAGFVPISASVSKV